VNELNVKVGDKVIVHSQYNEYISKITHITKTGRIRTDGTGATYFDKNGNQIGGDIWHRVYITIPTEEDYKRLNKLSIVKKAVNLMGRYGVDDISVEQAEKIIEILGKSEVEN
jgi:hypothetical protein